jgi:hypothetical protein
MALAARAVVCASSAPGEVAPNAAAAASVDRTTATMAGSLVSDFSEGEPSGKASQITVLKTRVCWQGASTQGIRRSANARRPVRPTRRPQPASCNVQPSADGGRNFDRRVRRRGTVTLFGKVAATSARPIIFNRLTAAVLCRAPVAFERATEADLNPNAGA